MTTRDRLLQAAVDEFAAKGYREATVAEICRRAEANIAAVNYHFGSKEALYQEAWRQAHQAADKANPPAGRVPAAAPAKARLRGRLRALLQRALGDEDMELRIMQRELLNPTGLLDQVIHQTLEPMRLEMARIVRELLGDLADDTTVELCVLSVVGPCLHVLHRPRPAPGRPAPPWLGPEMLDTLTEHCTAFALAGIREARRRLRAETRGKPSRASGQQGTTH